MSGWRSCPSQRWCTGSFDSCLQSQVNRSDQSHWQPWTAPLGSMSSDGDWQPSIGGHLLPIVGQVILGWPAAGPLQTCQHRGQDARVGSRWVSRPAPLTSEATGFQGQTPHVLVPLGAGGCGRRATGLARSLGCHDNHRQEGQQITCHLQTLWPEQVLEGPSISYANHDRGDECDPARRLVHTSGPDCTCHAVEIAVSPQHT